MPPEVKPLPVPRGRGEDCVQFFNDHGIEVFGPSIRSSDAGLLNTCPFYYFLRRRLALVPAIEEAKKRAMTCGSWAHVAFEFVTEPTFARRQALFTSRLERETTTQRTLLKTIPGLGDNTIADIIHRDKQYAMTAFAWMEAAFHDGDTGYRDPSNEYLRDGIQGFLGRYRELGSELEVTTKHSGLTAPSTIQLDKLLWHEKSNTLWILDLKTTSIDPILRAQTCAISFQTWHYLATAMQTPLTPDTFGGASIPRDAKIGGMIHLIIQTPSITFGQNDRDYFYHAESKRSKSSGRAELKNGQWNVRVTDEAGVAGELNGLKDGEQEAVRVLQEMVGVKAKKAYYDEPSIGNYIRRCRSWYRCESDYENRVDKAEYNPPIVISKTYASVLDSSTMAEYLSIAEMIARYATLPAAPQNFPRLEGGMLRKGRLSEYAPFYLSPVKDWPEIMRRESFIQSPRN